MSDRARKIWDGCINNDEAMILRGISLKENVDSLGSGGKTPLIYSCAMGQEVSIRALLTANPDPFIRDTIKNKSAMDYLMSLRDRRFPNKQTMIDLLQTYMDNYSIEEPDYRIHYMEFRQLITKEPIRNQTSFHEANGKTAKLVPSRSLFQNEVNIIKAIRKTEEGSSIIGEVSYVAEDVVTFKEGGSLHGIVYEHSLSKDHLEAYLQGHNVGILEKLGIIESLLLGTRFLNDQGIVFLCMDSLYLLKGESFPRWKFSGLEFASFIGTQITGPFPEQRYPTYAPEVARALLNKETYHASPSMDTWSLGLLCFKILTESSLYETLNVSTKEEVDDFLLRSDEEIQEDVDFVLESFELPPAIHKLLRSLLRVNAAERPSLDSFQNQFTTSFISMEEQGGDTKEGQERVIEEDSLEEVEEEEEPRQPLRSSRRKEEEEEESPPSIDWQEVQRTVSSSIKRDYEQLHRSLEEQVAQLRDIPRQVESTLASQHSSFPHVESGLSLKEMDGLLAENQVNLVNQLTRKLRDHQASMESMLLEQQRIHSQQQQREGGEGGEEEREGEKRELHLSEESMYMLNEHVRETVESSVGRLLSSNLTSQIARVMPDYTKEFDQQTETARHLEERIVQIIKRQERKEKERQETNNRMWIEQINKILEGQRKRENEVSQAFASQIEELKTQNEDLSAQLRRISEIVERQEEERMAKKLLKKEQKEKQMVQASFMSPSHYPQTPQTPQTPPSSSPQTGKRVRSRSPSPSRSKKTEGLHQEPEQKLRIGDIAREKILANRVSKKVLKKKKKKKTEDDMAVPSNSIPVEGKKKRSSSASRLAKKERSLFNDYRYGYP